METVNKRIAKNTAYLYLRMLIVMAVTIYTSRVVLDTLGIDDYGIYNLVGGVVVLFSFLNSSMTTCTQRYLCVAIAKKDNDYERDVFSTSIIAHILICILFLVLAETIGLWLVAKVLNISPESKTTTIIVYQIAIFTAITSILRVPFNGAIIAQEKMDFYALSSIIEVILKLAILFPLVLLPTNKLILYSILVAFVNIVVLLWYRWYVHRHFGNCRISYRKLHKRLLKDMLTFTGWSNFSSLSNLSAKQGMGFILNHFFGVAINATVGIMNQVTSAVYGFITNFMTALNPPLIKMYVAQKRIELENLVIKSSKFSFYMMLTLSVPIIMNMEPILNVWLIEVPRYASEFCSLSLISLLPNVIGGPIWTIIQASGKIKTYQIIIGLLILVNLPADYIMLRCGMQPYSILLITLLINFAVDIVGIRFVNKFTGIKISTMFFRIIVPCVAITALSFLGVISYTKFLGLRNIGFSHFIIDFVIQATIVLTIVLVLGMSSNERKSLFKIMTRNKS